MAFVDTCTLILEQMDLHLAGSGIINLCALAHRKFALVIKLELVMSMWVLFLLASE